MKRITVIAVALAIAGTFSPVIIRSQILWDGSFTGSEVWNGRFNTWGVWPSLCSYTSDGVTVMNAFNRDGEYMTKFVVNPDTRCYGVNEDPMRVELHNQTTANSVINEGTEEFYGFSYYQSPGFVAHLGDWKNIWQIKARMLRHINPNLRLTIQQAGLYMSICGGDITGITSGCGSLLLSYLILPTAQLSNGIWHDYVVRVKWSKTNGIVQVWHKLASESDYALISTTSGVATLAHESGTIGDINLRGMGNYRSTEGSGPGYGLKTDEDITYGMAYKIGKTFDDVKYNGITPCGGPDTWVNNSFSLQAGSFSVEFDATPSANNIDGVVGLSNGAAAAYTDLACIVRFNPSGNIDVRSGSVYQMVNTVPYTSGTSYHVKMDVNISTKKYDVYVTPQGGAQQTIALQYDFRTEQNAVTQLNNWDKNTTSCTIDVKNFIVNTVTGINSNNSSTQFAIYPNPSEGKAVVEINLFEKENVQISIHNVLGEEIGIVTNSEMSAGTHKLALSDYLSKAGVYIIRVKAGSSVINRKLINFR